MKLDFTVFVKRTVLLPKILAKTLVFCLCMALKANPISSKLLNPTTQHELETLTVTGLVAISVGHWQLTDILAERN